MLPHSRNASSSLSNEQDIINSFYEERKSRASSAKHHNLLRKNISYFHQDQTPIADNKLNVSKIELKPVSVPVGGSNNNTPIASVVRERKFSLSNHSEEIFSSLKNIKNKAILSDGLLDQPFKQNHLQQPAICNNVNKGFHSKDLQQSDLLYRQHLKNEMNKRINIQNYLSQINNELKDNQSNFNSMRSDSQAKINYQNQLKSTHFQLYNSRTVNPDQLNQSVDEHKPKKLKNKPFPPLNTHNRSVDSNHIKDSRKRKHDTRRQQNSNKRDNYENKENTIVNRKSENYIKGEKRKHQNNFNSHSSLNIDEDNFFQFSKNRITDRTQVPRHTFGSQKSNSGQHNSIISNDSFKKSSESSKKKVRQDCLNRLNSQQLAELQTNSHPLRQPISETYNIQPAKLKFNYFDPETEANYKRRIEDLQKQVQELRGKHRREDKFIQSIAKMRRVMEDRDEREQCSLKELWRWIKQLPGKRG